MMRWRTWAAVLWLPCAMAAAAGETVELDYRLRAERDLVVEQVDENVTTMRVVTDNGLVARTGAQGARFPLTYHTVNRQRSRYTTGALQVDGSFPATLAILSRRAMLRLASGAEQPAPGQTDMDNFVFKAVIDAQGRVQQPTLQVDGLDGERLNAVRGVMTSVLEQAARIETIRVEQGKAVDQDVNMQVPLPGLAPLDLKITATNRLIAVKEGMAQVEMVYVMAFGVPDGPVKIEATGTGGGTLVYDIAARVARRIETNTLMTIVTHMPDGTLEFQMNTRQTQHTQDAGR